MHRIKPGGLLTNTRPRIFKIVSSRLITDSKMERIRETRPGIWLQYSVMMFSRLKPQSKGKRKNKENAGNNRSRSNKLSIIK